MPLILSAANCIGAPLRAVKGTRFITRVRSDVLLKALRGDPLPVDYDVLKENGVTVYKIGDYSRLAPDVFLWSPFVDSNARFWIAGGVPISPVPPTPFDASVWMAKYYAQADALKLSGRVGIAIKIDAQIKKLNPNVRRILMIYESAQLIGQVESGNVELLNTLNNNASANVAIAAALQSLGWEIVFEPHGIRKRGAGWYHSRFDLLERLYKSIGLL